MQPNNCPGRYTTVAYYVCVGHTKQGYWYKYYLAEILAPYKRPPIVSAIGALKTV